MRTWLRPIKFNNIRFGVNPKAIPVVLTVTRHREPSGIAGPGPSGSHEKTTHRVRRAGARPEGAETTVTTINGLPAHALLVHLVVVLLPLVAAGAILASIWPAAQRKLTFLIPLGALVGLIAVPLTVSAGEYLEQQLASSPLIARHAQLAEMVLPWTISLFVLTTAQWAYLRGAAPKRGFKIALTVLVIASAVGTIAMVGLTGDAGSQAVWAGFAG